MDSLQAYHMCSLVSHEGGDVMHVAMHCFVFILHVQNIVHFQKSGSSISFCHRLGTRDDGP